MALQVKLLVKLVSLKTQIQSYSSGGRRDLTLTSTRELWHVGHECACAYAHTFRKGRGEGRETQRHRENRYIYRERNNVTLDLKMFWLLS